jgi:hypothetical protein
MGTARTRWQLGGVVAAVACDAASPPLLTQRVEGVVMLDGPQAGARVTLRPLDADGREGETVAEGRTDAQGGYSLRFAGTPGAYRVVAALAGGAVAEGGLIPVAHLVHLGGGDGDAAAIGLLQGGIAAAVVGMQMGIDQQVELVAATLAQYVPNQGLRLFGMADVAAVDHRHFVAAEQQHVVGG